MLKLQRPCRNATKSILNRQYSTINNMNNKTAVTATTFTKRQLFLLGSGLGLLGYGSWYYYQNNKDKLDGNTYIPLTLIDKRKVSPDTVQLRLQIEKNQIPSGEQPYPIPSCVYIKDDHIQIMRPYTPINSNPYKDGFIDLIVKRYPGGSVSKTLSSTSLNDSIFVRGPMIEEYQYKSNTKDEIGMIAGGTGISPMYQMIKHILTNSKEDETTKLWLIYANKTEQDILLKEELDQLEKEHSSRFKIKYVLEYPKNNWEGEKGRVSESIIRSMLHETSSSDHKRLIFVSGPDGMLNFICGQRAIDFTQGKLSGVLAKLGLKSSEVWKFQ
ncbi:unnamed protein product [Cunninghamella blakesleeana]